MYACGIEGALSSPRAHVTDRWIVYGGGLKQRKDVLCYDVIGLFYILVPVVNIYSEQGNHPRGILHR